MPGWIKLLQHQWALHVWKERIRAHRHYAMPALRSQRSVPSVEMLEPRLLFSGTPATVDPDEPVAAITIDGSSLTGRDHADALTNAGGLGTLSGGGGDDALAVLREAPDLASTVEVDGGEGDDMVFVHGASVTIEGGIGYDAVYITGGKITAISGVEELWYRPSPSDDWASADPSKPIDTVGQSTSGLSFFLNGFSTAALTNASVTYIPTTVKYHPASVFGGAASVSASTGLSGGGGGAVAAAASQGQPTGVTYATHAAASASPHNYSVTQPPEPWHSGDLTGDGVVDGLDIDAAYQLDPMNFESHKDLFPDGKFGTIESYGRNLDVDHLVLGLLQTEYADFNLDGKVGTNDLAIIAANFGTGSTWAHGDANGDGAVNTGDLAVQASHFGFDAFTDQELGDPRATETQILYGRFAPDTIQGGIGDDFIWSGDGADTVVTQSSGAVVVDTDNAITLAGPGDQGYSANADGDGLTNFDEVFRAHTDPTVADSGSVLIIPADATTTHAITVQLADPSLDSDGAVWRVDWGDGTTSLIDSATDEATHTYAEPSIYEIKAQLIPDVYRGADGGNTDIYIPAEGFHAASQTESSAWDRLHWDVVADGAAENGAYLTTNTHVEHGYSHPNAGSSEWRLDPGTETKADTPRVDYKFEVSDALVGIPLYIWVKMKSGSGGEADNSVYVGIDGAPLSGLSDSVGVSVDAAASGWTLVGEWNEAALQITALSAGVHTLNLWMREDGVQIDTLYLTSSASTTWTPDPLLTPQGIQVADHSTAGQLVGEDPVVMKALRQELGLAENAAVDLGDLANVSRLTLDSNTVASLNDLASLAPYLSNLSELHITPSDWSEPARSAADLDPLLASVVSVLPQIESLTTVSLQRIGLEDADLKALADEFANDPNPSLATLDLTYNELSELPDNLTSGLSGLTYLDVYSNVLLESNIRNFARGTMSGVTDYSSGSSDNPIKGIAGTLVNLDLPTEDPNVAKSVDELARRLYFSPIRMQEWVYNNVEFQIYPGIMKSPLAVMQTRAGNNFDTSFLLEALLKTIDVDGVLGADIATDIEIGEVDIPIAEAMNWFSVADSEAAFVAAAILSDYSLFAEYALGKTGDERFTHFQPHLSPTTISVWHAWLDVTLPDLTNIDFDTSIKVHDLPDSVSSFVADIWDDSALPVNFDWSEYLGQGVDKSLNTVRTESAIDWYVHEQVEEYVADSQPGTSLADLTFSGPIIPIRLTNLDNFAAAPVNTLKLSNYSDDQLHSGIVVQGGQLGTEYTGLEYTDWDWLHHQIQVKVTYDDGPTPEVINTQFVHVRDVSLGRLSIDTRDTNNGSKQIRVKHTSFDESSVDWFVPEGEIDHMIAVPDGGRIDIDMRSASPHRIYSGSYKDRSIDETFVVALGALQHSETSLAAKGLEITAAGRAHAQRGGDNVFLSPGESGNYSLEAQRQDSLIRGVLDLTGAMFSHQNWRDAETISRTFGVIEYSNFVKAGLVSGLLELDVVVSEDVRYSLTFPFVPSEMLVDNQIGGVDNSGYIPSYVISNSDQAYLRRRTGFIAIDGSTVTVENDRIFLPSLDSTGQSVAFGISYASVSANEHRFVERIANAQAVSSVKALQVASNDPSGSQVLYVAADAAALVNAGVPSSAHTVVTSQNDLGSATSLAYHLPYLSDFYPDAIDTLWSRLSGDSRAYAIVHKGTVEINEWEGWGYLLIGETGVSAAISGGFQGADVTERSQPGFYAETNDQQVTFSDPVNVATGAVVHDETDISLPSVGPGLMFARHYDSSLLAHPYDTSGSGGTPGNGNRFPDRGIGHGWTHSYSDRLTGFGSVAQAGATRTWHDQHGVDHVFDYEKIISHSDGTYTAVWKPRAGSVGVLTSNVFEYTPTDHSPALTYYYSGGTYRWHSPDGGFRQVESVASESYSRLTRIADRFGNTIEIAYVEETFETGPIPADTIDKVWVKSVGSTETAATATRYLDFDFITDQSQPTITDDTGRVWTYTLENNQLKRVGLPTTSSDSNVATTSTKYMHYLYHPVSSGAEIDPLENLLTDVIESESESVAGISSTDPVTSYSYYLNRRAATVTDSEDHVEYISYNPFASESTLTDARGFSTTYLYDTDGRLDRLVHPDGSSIRNEWDPDTGLKSAIYNEVGTKTEFTYTPDNDNFNGYADYSRQLATETVWQNVDSDAALEATVTEFSYQSHPTTDPLNPGTAMPGGFSHDLVSVEYVGVSGASDDRMVLEQSWSELHGAGAGYSLEWMRDAEGNTTLYQYDSANNPIGQPDRIVSPRGVVVDALGQPKLLNAGDGAYTTHFDYDEFGRVTETKTRTNAGATHSLDQGDFITESWTYYDQGPIRTHIDPNNNVRRYTVDARGRLVQEELPDPDLPLNVTRPSDPEAATFDDHATFYVYDFRDRLDRLVESTTGTADTPGAGDDPYRRETQYIYDGMNRQTTVIRADGTRSKIWYDASGNAIATVDPAGRVNSSVYDSRHRLLANFNAVGNLSRFDYDAANRNIRSIDARGYATTVKYDELGRATEITDADGNTTETEYDAHGNVVAVIDQRGNRSEFVYDELDRVIEAKQPDPDSSQGRLTTYTGYDANGNIARETDPRGTATNDALYTTYFVYDEANRLIETRRQDPEWIPPPVISDPIAHWKFDESSGLVANDSAGSNVVNLSSDASFSASPPWGGAIQFNGANSSFAETQLGVLSAGANPFSLSVAFKLDVLPETGSSSILIKQKHGSVPGNTLLSIKNNEVGYTDEIVTGVGGVMRSNISVVADQWYHFVLAYDGTHLRMFVDGTLVAEETRDLAALPGLNGEQLYFGKNPQNNNSNSEGLLSEVRIFDYVIDQPQAAELASDPGRLFIDEGRYLSSYMGYDHAGNLTWQTDARGEGPLVDAIGVRAPSHSFTTTYAFDAWNRSKSTTTPDPDGISSVDASNIYDPLTSTVIYDVRGNRIASTRHNGATTNWSYDKLDRLVESQLPAAQPGDARPTSTVRFDAVGNAVESVDPNGNVSRVVFDDVNRSVTSTSVRAQPFYVGNIITSVEYDPNGNVIEAVDARGKVTTREYDKLNRLVTETLPDPDGAEGADYESPVYKYQYDEASNLIGSRDARGFWTWTYYDSLNRPYVTVSPLAQSSPDLDGDDSRPGIDTITAIGDLADGDSLVFNVADFRSGYNEVEVTWASESDAVVHIATSASGPDLASITLPAGMNGWRTETFSIPLIAGSKSLHVRIEAITPGDEISLDISNLRFLQNTTTPSSFESEGLIEIGAVAYGSQGSIDSVGDGYLWAGGNGFLHTGNSESVNGDELSFLYREVVDPSLLEANIDITSGTSTHSRGGLMIRADSTANSQYLAIGLGLGGGLYWSYRTDSAESGHQSVAANGLTGSQGFRIEKVADGFQAYHFDGAAWSTIGSVVDLQLGDAVLAGIFGIVSHNSHIPNASARFNIGDTVIVEDLPALELRIADLASQAGGTLFIDAENSSGTSVVNYDSIGNVEWSIDSNGLVTEYAYDSLGRLVERRMPDPDGDGPEVSPVYQFAYDEVGNTIGSRDARGFWSWTYYDQLSRVERIANALGQSIDENDGTRPDVIVMADDRLTKYRYDSAGRLDAVEDALGNAVSYDYDDLNRVATETRADPDGLSSQYNSPEYHFRYDLSGNQIGSSDARGFWTWTYYDELYRMTDTVTSFGLDLAAVESSPPILTGVDRVRQSRVSSLVLDDAGNVIESVDADGVVTTYAYDALNRLEHTTQIDPQDGSANTTTRRFDEDGNVVSTTDPLNQTTRYVYDQLGRQTHVISARNTNAEPDLATADYVTETQYDEVGNVKKIIDANGRETTYDYDNLYRLLSESVWLDGPGMAAHARTYLYDADGSMTLSVDRNGRQVVYAYDELGRQTTESWFASGADTAGVPDRFITTSYDEVGNIETINDSATGVGVVDHEFVYDNLYRVTTEYSRVLEPLNAFELYFEYDADGRVEWVEQKSGSNPSADTQLTHTYDAMGRRISSSQSGTLVQSKMSKFEYSPAGRSESVTRGTKIKSLYQRDALGRLIELGHRTGDKLDAVAATHNLTFDDAGRIATTQTRDSLGNVIDDAVVTYDEENQLFTTSRTGDDGLDIGDESYSYDETGNRLGNQVDPYDRLMSDGTYTYTYDNEGNLRTRTAGTVVVTYDWDHRNRLVGAITKDAGQITQTVEYVYDALDRLVKRTVTDGQSGPSVGTITDDTHVQRGAPDDSFGSDYRFNVKGQVGNSTEREAYLRFALPANIDPTQPATLTLTVESNGDVTPTHPSIQHAVYALDNAAWSESTTWNTMPALGSQIAILDPITPNYSGTVSATIPASVVQSWVNDGLTEVSLGIQGVTPTNDSQAWVNYYSSEAGDGGNPGTAADRPALSLSAFNGGSGNVTTTEFTYHGAHRWSAAVDGELVQQTFYGPGVDQLLAVDQLYLPAPQLTQTNWTLEDPQGSVRDVVNTNGNVLDHRAYDAFGNLMVSTAAAAAGKPVESTTDIAEGGIDFAYTSRPFDASSGLQYSRARWLDLESGRFISEDPAGFVDGTHLYRYVANNPMNFADPSGLAMIFNGGGGKSSGGGSSRGADSSASSFDFVTITSPTAAGNSVATRQSLGNDARPSVGHGFSIPVNSPSSSRVASLNWVSNTLSHASTSSRLQVDDTELPARDSPWGFDPAPHRIAVTLHNDYLNESVYRHNAVVSKALLLNEDPGRLDFNGSSYNPDWGYRYVDFANESAPHRGDLSRPRDGSANAAFYDGLRSWNSYTTRRQGDGASLQRASLEYHLFNTGEIVGATAILEGLAGADVFTANYLHAHERFGRAGVGSLTLASEVLAVGRGKLLTGSTKREARNSTPVSSNAINTSGDISLDILNPKFSPDPTRIVGSGNAASVAFEVKLPASMYPGVSARKHIQNANTQLLNAIDADPALASMIDDLIPDVKSQLTRPRSVSPQPPADWTWHHAVDEGYMHLTPSIQHWDPSLWGILHPDGKGGMSMWGGGY